jgi:DNA-binding transcriptional ArsR family regulator
MRSPTKPPDALRLLEDPLRKRMFELVEARPGITATRLRDLLDVSWDGYHLAAHDLEAMGLLKVRAAGRRTLYYACTTPGRVQEDAPRLAVLLVPMRAKIARTIRDEPGLEAGHLPEKVDARRFAVYRHLTALARAGLITREPEAGWTNLKPAKDLDALLLQLDVILR